MPDVRNRFDRQDLASSLHSIYTPYMTCNAFPSNFRGMVANFSPLNITNDLKRGNTNEWCNTETDKLYQEHHANQTISVSLTSMKHKWLSSSYFLLMHTREVVVTTRMITSAAIKPIMMNTSALTPVDSVTVVDC